MPRAFRRRQGVGAKGSQCFRIRDNFCPSHVLPLAAPGAVKGALRALFKPHGGFYIKPRLDPSLLSWLYHFSRRCNPRDMMEAGHAIGALLSSSRHLYEDLLRDEAIQCEWESRGLLFVFQTHSEWEHYAKVDALLAESFAMPAKRLDADALQALEPALKPGLPGGYHYVGDAHLRPDKLLAEWQRVLHAKGVTIHEQCPVESVIREHGRARAVVTPQGELAADVFVFATGAWTPLLSRHLGCKIPIQPGKGYSITMPRPARCPTIPLIFEEHRVAVTPFQSGYRLGSTMEFAGYDTSLNRGRLQLLKDAAVQYLHEPYCEPVEEEWYGWRPMTYDSKPVLDRSPALSNVWIAAGHNMLGLSMAPATGKLIAELLSEEKPHINPQPYVASRFLMK